jgi:hypothetical protein
MRTTKHLAAGRQGRHPQAGNLRAERSGRLQLFGRPDRADQDTLEFVEMFKAPIKMQPPAHRQRGGNYIGTGDIGAIGFGTLAESDLMH